MPKLTQNEIQAILAENEALKEKLIGRQSESLSIKIGESTKQPGVYNVRVYGLGRYPITLYANQWEKLLARADDILELIEENREMLSFSKDESEALKPKRRKARA